MQHIYAQQAPILLPAAQLSPRGCRFQLKSGLTSAPRLPQALQTSRGLAQTSAQGDRRSAKQELQQAAHRVAQFRLPTLQPPKQVQDWLDMNGAPV